MASQSWVEQGLAVVMIAMAGYCLACLVLPRLGPVTSHRDADLAHVVMAVSMAAMLLGVARPLWGGPLVLAFALPASWFALRAVRSLRRPAAGWLDAAQGTLGHVQLSVAGVAMVYMSGMAPGFGSTSPTPTTMTAIAPETPHGMGHAMTAAPGAAGSAGVDFALAGALIFAALAAFAFISIGQLAASADRTSPQVTRRLWANRLTVCCQLAMAATMAHMLAGVV